MFNKMGMPLLQVSKGNFIDCSSNHKGYQVTKIDNALESLLAEV